MNGAERKIKLSNTTEIRVDSSIHCLHFMFFQCFDRTYWIVNHGEEGAEIDSENWLFGANEKNKKLPPSKNWTNNPIIFVCKNFNSDWIAMAHKSNFQLLLLFIHRLITDWMLLYNFNESKMREFRQVKTNCPHSQSFSRSYIEHFNFLYIIKWEVVFSRRIENKAYVCFAAFASMCK